MAAMLTVCNPGDKVIIFSPFYENYGADTILSGAVPIYVPLRPPDFGFDPAELRKAVEEATKRRAEEEALRRLEKDKKDVAPGTLAAYVPWYLTHWHFAPPLFPIARVLGAALIVAGLPILLDSFARFALQGLGTPAPVMPPKRLVVTGFYRYVRNPMYVAVTALIAGQGLLFGSVTVLEYGAILWAGFFLFVVAYEEPALGEQFADEYKRYRANVRRWLPRITPWRG